MIPSYPLVSQPHSILSFPNAMTQDGRMRVVTVKNLEKEADKFVLLQAPAGVTDGTSTAAAAVIRIPEGAYTDTTPTPLA